MGPSSNAPDWRMAGRLVCMSSMQQSRSCQAQDSGRLHKSIAGAFYNHTINHLPRNH